MREDLEIKKKYADRYGAFFGAVIYKIKDIVSFGKTEQ